MSGPEKLPLALLQRALRDSGVPVTSPEAERRWRPGPAHQTAEEKSCAQWGSLTPAPDPTFQRFKGARSLPLRGKARLPRQGQAT